MERLQRCVCTVCALVMMLGWCWTQVQGPLAQAVKLRESQATEIQTQVRNDCCRYRYGDEQHLDEALGRVFLFNRPQGIPRRMSPTLVGLRCVLAARPALGWPRVLLENPAA